MNHPEIRVGLSVSTSGKFQLQGRQALKGILLWQSHTNAQGGISIGDRSRIVHLIWYDDESRVSRARENVLRLIRDDHVHILVGPYSSHLTMAAAEIAEEHKKVLWNYGGTSDAIFRRGWRYIIGISSPARDYFRTFPHWLAKEYPGISRICVMYSSKGTFASEVASGILESALDGKQSVDLVPFDIPGKSSGAVLARVRDLSPDAVVLAGDFQDELAIIRTRQNWPTTVRITAAVAAGISGFACHLRQEANGVLGPSQWEPGVSFPTIVGPSSDWFESRFQKGFGAKPDYIAADSFATGLIVAECIRQADSSESDRLRCVASRLDCCTFYGCFQIDAQSGKQVGHRMLLIRWRDGKRVVLYS